MKVLILAGGLGTRLAEETGLKPKPMVEIGGKPILWHILKMYSYFGFNDFVILLGYKGYLIKEYFANYFLHMSDLRIDIQANSIEYLNSNAEPWKITLIDTGVNTLTGGRIKRVEKIVNNEPFMLTYGDGVSDIEIPKLLEFHKSHGKKITMTSVQPEGRFGAIQINSDSRVLSFREKPRGDGAFVNGGFFVCEPGVFDYIKNGDSSVFEQEPLENLANDGELYTYMHKGFWKAMDNMRDKNQLEDMISNRTAPWIKW